VCEFAYVFADGSIRSGDIGWKEANNMSMTEERILRSVTLEKDESGSLGIQVTEGSDGAVYIQAVVPGGAADKQGVVKRGACVYIQHELSYFRADTGASQQVLPSSIFRVEQKRTSVWPHVFCMRNISARPLGVLSASLI
jgi:PDZ domain